MLSCVATATVVIRLQVSTPRETPEEALAEIFGWTQAK